MIALGYVQALMPRRHRKAREGGNTHSKGSGGGWMHSKRKKGKREDRAPLTPGSMHSRTRIR